MPSFDICLSIGSTNLSMRCSHELAKGLPGEP
jgi:hypothetical protein